MTDSTYTRPHSASPSRSINRKRTASTSEKKHPFAGRRTPSGSSHKNEGQSEKTHQREGLPRDVGGRAVKEKDSGRNTPMNGLEKAPSLNVDIRNSLILPLLSQRFSVLLPSLSTAPEESLRSLLASQRARHHGPALTEEEEDLLFAEMRDAAQENQWDGRPPQMDENWVRSGLGVSNKPTRAGGLPSSASSPSLLTTSTSSPSVLSTSDDGGQSYAPSTPGSFLASPPPTSNSFSSFQTFGVGSSPDTSANAGFKTKSYGFSGGSSMREAEYIRKVKKSFSLKDLKNGSGSGSISSRKSEHTPTRENIPLPPAISPEKANAYYQPTKRPESPTTSEKTATPTSSIIPDISSSSLPGYKKGHSPSSSLSLNPPTPNSAEDQMFAGKQQRARKRQSRLDGLSPAQVKRISLALQEIGGQLKRGSMTVQAVPERAKEQSTSEDVEEMLDPESRRVSQLDTENESNRARRPSDLRSGDSCQSATSSVFPFQMSPTNSTFTGTTTEPSSPSKLPPSPRTHNLLAHVEEPLPPIPMPVFTPTRSQPVRHQPTLSNSSTSTVALNQPVYIPGQPRPIRLTHHSQSSVSSRSATPSNQSPLDAIRTAVSPDNTPSPIKSMPAIVERSTCLGRSRSVNQAQVTPTKSILSGEYDGSSGSTNGTRRRAGTIGDAPMNRRLSSSLSSHPTTPDIIEEEAEETPSDRDEYSSGPQSIEEFVPEVKQVVGRHSVANSRTTSSNSIHQLHHNLGWELAPGQEPFERSVSAQGTIDESPNPTPPEANDAPQSPTTTLRRQTSSTSISSSFSEDAPVPGEIVWASVFNGDSPNGYDVGSDGMVSPEPGKEAEVLRKMSGMGMEELMLLQERLVMKAKAEREALRGDVEDSAFVPYSPPMSAEAFSPTQRAMSPILRATSPDLARPISPPPPSSWRFPPAELPQPSSQNTTPSQDKSTLPSSVDTHIMTPPLTGSSTGASVSRSGSKSNLVMLPTRPAPPPPRLPADTPSEHADDIQTPPSGDLSRKSSNRAHFRLPLEQDPEIRKDFEARIAAATAALNRTPSVSNSKLDRKFSKKGGPMVISSPKLVSSTANVPTTPLTPESQVEPGLVKSLEKSSGSGSKMSLKWKKFTGLRSKGPSFSGNEVTPYPPAPQQPVQSKLSPNKQLQQQQQQQQQMQQQQSKLSPIQNVVVAQGGLQRSASASVTKILEDPISLRAEDHPEAPPSAPPNLDAFRFPPPPERAAHPTTSAPQQDVPSPPSSLGHSSGLKHVMSKMKRSKEISPPPQQAQGRSQSPIPAQTGAISPLPAIDAITKQPPRHTPTSSDEDARNKFIEAGRALGLTEEQLNDMLTAKGMAGTASSAPAVPSPLSATPVVSDEKVVKHEKEKKGLFRSLSKARRAQPSPTPVSAPVPISGLAPSAPVTELLPAPVPDRVVVRRTMILPEGLNIIPSTPQTTSTTPKIPESPDSSSLRPGINPQRKQSIRRKPLKLSEEDHELVSNSPPAHRRNFSFSNASVDSNGTNTPSNPSFTPSPSNSQNQVPTTGAGAGELHGLGFLHPNSTPLNKKSSAPSLTPSPGNSSTGGGDDESHARSSTGGSLIDMYRNDDDEELLESPEKKTSATFSHDDEFIGGHARKGSEDALGRGSLDRRRMTQAVEITEYADGQVIWNIVDALRTSVTGSVDGEEYTFDTPGVPHSRSTSYSSSVRNSVIPEDEDVFHAAGNNAGWPKALGNGTAGLNFRHRDRNVPKKPRPPTDVYFTSHADVADLIDHLSRDLDASHGRIDIISHPTSDSSEWPHSNNSPFGFQDSATTTIPTTPERVQRRSSQTQSPAHSQFEDAPSPAQFSLRPTISPVKADQYHNSGNMVENLSPGPQRQLFNEPNSRGQSYISTGGSAAGFSPSSKSFASSVSGQGKSVEDRLQALLDRLKGDGIGRTRL